MPVPVGVERSTSDRKGEEEETSAAGAAMAPVAATRARRDLTSILTGGDESCL